MSGGIWPPSCSIAATSPWLMLHMQPPSAWHHSHICLALFDTPKMLCFAAGHLMCSRRFAPTPCVTTERQESSLWHAQYSKASHLDLVYVNFHCGCSLCKLCMVQLLHLALGCETFVLCQSVPVCTLLLADMCRQLQAGPVLNATKCLVSTCCAGCCGSERRD